MAYKLGIAFMLCAPTIAHSADNVYMELSCQNSTRVYFTLMPEISQGAIQVVNKVETKDGRYVSTRRNNENGHTFTFVGQNETYQIDYTLSSHFYLTVLKNGSPLQYKCEHITSRSFG